MKALVLLLTAALAGATSFAQTTACKKTEEKEITLLFDQWNDALKTGSPDKVVALYAPESILLPTLSNTPRLTSQAKQDYFTSFMAKSPVGRIESGTVQLGCNSAVASGLYTFNFGDGSSAAARYTYTYAWNGEKWLITSHHSSAMPEK